MDEGLECLKQITDIDYDKIDDVIWNYLRSLDKEKFHELRDRINLIHFIIDEYKDRFYFEP